MAYNSKVVNIWGNAAPDIGSTSGTDQTLRIWNTGTGNALQVDSGGTVPAMVVTTNAAGAATVAPLQVVASTASQAYISFAGAFISTASINPTKAAFVIPVYHQTQAVWGYIIASSGIS